MVDELFAESPAFVRVFDGFFVADAGKADTLDDYTNAFMIEVCHDDWMNETVSVGTCVMGDVGLHYL